VLVIRSIRVVYDLKIPAEQRDTAERVHEYHAGFCPVARTLAGCVRIETELGFRD
jgi:organic hydroperoxide reductase OsmC/OhrA